MGINQQHHTPSLHADKGMSIVICRNKGMHTQALHTSSCSVMDA